MWVVYGGIALQDPFVLVPNAVGLVLAGTQLTLKLVLPSFSSSKSSDSSVATVATVEASYVGVEGKDGADVVSAHQHL